MSKNIRNILLFMCCIAFAFCTNQEANSTQTKDATKVFFDLRSFIEAAIEDYSEKEVKVNKRVLFGNKTEYLENLEIDWKTELQPFLQSDINRIAWIDKFSIDTIKVDSSYSVIYNNSVASIPIKLMEIFFDSQGEVETINIQSTRKNLLYNSKQTLSLLPEKSYTVSGFQKAMFLKRTDFEVKGELNYK